MAAIDPSVASAEIGTASRVAGAEDGVVVVAVVVAVARAKALWARQVTAAVPKAAESASTRSRRSAVKDKVIVAANRWRTDMIISTSMVKVAMLAARMKAMSITRTSSIRLITRTDRAIPAHSAIRADSETRVARVIIRTGRVMRAGSETRVASELSSWSALRSRRASRTKLVNLGTPASRRKAVNHASLVRRANRGKHVSHVSPANLGSRVSSARSNTTRPRASRSSTNRNSVKAASGRQSSRRTTLVRHPPLSPVTRDRRSRLLCGPRHRPATDATSKVS